MAKWSKFMRRAWPQLMIIAGDDGVFIQLSSLNNPPATFFTANAFAGIEHIRALLTSYPKLRITLLINQLAQDYKIDILPKLNPFDCRTLIARRLRAAFPDADLRAWLPSRHQRRQILTTGVSLSGHLPSLLDLLQDRYPCLGLLPLECAQMLGELAPISKDGWAILLAPMQTGAYGKLSPIKANWHSPA